MDEDDDPEEKSGVHDCVQSVMADGHDESSAYAICEAQQKARDDGVDDPEAVGAVTAKIATGEWQGLHKSEETVDGRSTLVKNHLRRARSYLSENPDDHVQMAKSDPDQTVDKVDFEVSGSIHPLFKSDDRMVIWGPASVEIVDKEGERIRAEALKDALPQLLRRKSLSWKHSDQIVGDIIDKFEAEEPRTVEVKGHTFTRKEFPTDVLKFEGIEPALYCAGEIFSDTKRAEKVREGIDAGEVNSFSISGEAIRTKVSIEDGEPVTDILKIDLSAVTVCESGMNQKAGFDVVAKSDVDVAFVEKDRDPEDSEQTPVSPEEAASIIDKRLTSMSDPDDDNETDEEPLTKEAFEDALDDALPDGEIATKETVEQTVEKKIEEKMPEDVPDEEPEEPEADEVPEEPDEDMEKYTMQELKSALPDDLGKAVEQVLQTKNEEEGYEDVLGELDVTPDDEEEPEEEEPEVVEAAKSLEDIDPEKLTDEQKTALLKSVQENDALTVAAGTGDVAGIGKGDFSGGDSLGLIGESDPEALVEKGEGVTGAGSNWFDEEGGLATPSGGDN